MAIKKKEACCCEGKHGGCGGMVVSHLFFVLGAILVTKGVMTLTGNIDGFLNVFKSAFFWGIIAIMGGYCTVAGMHHRH
ncbi:hypothetical protein COT47_00085 [Candidatus Woesearchaeota archaeon CG08_land_8_20_14_0_20_43_7]|nr:MAG: hypothetical protein COT47_00085 [Candidatus Woesearchaeota archaeon CG08_land_8_20_14_0_20_43_7]